MVYTYFSINNCKINNSGRFWEKFKQLLNNLGPILDKNFKQLRSIWGKIVNCDGIILQNVRLLTI